MRAVIGLCLLAPFSLLLGCATFATVWTKVDGSAGDVATDLRECRVLANDEMWRIGWERRWPPRFYDPRFMPPFYNGRRAFWLDFPSSYELQHSLVDFCMHSKGYRLERLPH